MDPGSLVDGAMAAAATIGASGSGYLVWWSRNKAEATHKADLEAKARADAAAASWPGLNDALDRQLDKAFEQLEALRSQVAALRDQVEECETRHRDADDQRRIDARRITTLEQDLRKARERIAQLESTAA